MTEKHNKKRPAEAGTTPPKRRPTASAVLDDGTIVEMLHRPAEHKTLFCVAKDGQMQEIASVKVPGALLVPYSPDNNLLVHGVVLFPTEPAAYDSDQALVAEIRAFIHAYVDVSPLFEEVASYYVLFSWLYDSFDELPYLRVRGDTGSGKTRCLMTIGSLCYKPIFASGASTVSPIFRILDSFRGTLIVDEADFRFSDEQSEIVKILNNGNARGFPVLRSESINGREFDPRAYSVFGPKMIASRRYFQDRALETRCVTEETGRQRLRDDIPLNLGPDWALQATALRNKLLLFRFRNYNKRHLDPAVTDRTIEPRLAQLFGPLLSVVDDLAARTHLADLARDYHNDLIIDRGFDTEAHVLEVIRDMAARSSTAPVAIKELARQFSDRHAADYDRKITPKWIGNIVRRNLQLRTHKSHGVFVVTPGQVSRLARLYDQYGLAQTDTPTELAPDDASTPPAW